MKKLLLLIILITTNIVSAEGFDHELYNAQTITKKITISNTIHIQGVANKLEIRLNYFPRDKIIQENLYGGKKTEEYILYEYKDITGDKTIRYDSIVESKIEFPKITKKITYPYDVPINLQSYLQDQDIISISPEIKQQAAKIIGSEDDAVVAVHKIAEWTNKNIEYNLNTITAKASKSSEWVLENKQGVCDELTSLFISMVRSQGIPARFVSGVAYTNLAEIDTNWGSHGWAEVWYPNIGWVPYDVTYGQYGYLDATHTPYQYSLDAVKAAINYEMSSYGATLTTGSLNRTTQLITRKGITPYNPKINVSVALEKVGFGSYNRIDAEIINPYNYYLPVRVSIAQVNELEITSPTRYLLLKPKQKQIIHWYVKVNELQQGYTYTFPIQVYTTKNNFAETEFKVSEKELKVSKEDIDVTQESTSQLTGNWNCTHPENIIVNQTFNISCEFKGAEKICVLDCINTDKIIQEITINKVGVTTISAEASKKNEKSSYPITITAVDEPKLSFNISYPEEISSNKQFKITVNITQESYSKPNNIRLSFIHEEFSKKISIDEFNQQTNVELLVDPLRLYEGTNKITILLDYNNIKQEKQILIRVNSAGLWHKIILWLNKL